MKRVLFYLKQTLIEARKDRIQGYYCGLAYYQFLSMGPLMAFLIYGSNKILGEAKTKEKVIPTLEQWFTDQFICVVNFFLQQEHKMNAYNQNLKLEGLTIHLTYFLSISKTFFQTIIC